MIGAKDFPYTLYTVTKVHRTQHGYHEEVYRGEVVSRHDKFITFMLTSTDQKLTHPRPYLESFNYTDIGDTVTIC